MTRVLPRSLFGRVVLVVAALLIVAQLASLALHMQDRGELLMQASGMRAAQRTADIVKLFDSVSATDRERIAKVLSAPPLLVRVGHAKVLEDTETEQGAGALLFASMLRRFLGDDRMVRVQLSEFPSAAGQFGRMRGPMAMGGSHMGGWGPFGTGMGHMHQPAIALLAQVALNDGALVTVESRQPAQTLNWPYRLFWSIGIVVLAAVLVAWIAVRWTTRPLHTLAVAADELGRNVNRPPIAETGPTEVARAARAFNKMQSQLIDYLSSRTRMLAAMSHDLKTPITRLRLRAELLDDPKLRTRYCEDLQELESMVTATLDFLRGIQNEEPARAFDVTAMLEALTADLKDAGASVAIEGQAEKPYTGQRQALRRCLSNLLDNAIKYGGGATVVIADTTEQLIIRVLDSGPGIPPGELEKVFEPFYRTDSSRGRETGGTGLGLAIARQIARAQGGDVTVMNRAGGGLEARLVLPHQYRPRPEINPQASA